jgi:hypothetical protein
MTMATKIRPRPEFLRGLPTLKVRAAEDCTQRLRDFLREKGIDWKQELKLETPTACCWLCTSGLAEVPAWGGGGFVVGQVSAEYRQSDGTWEVVHYGPEDAARLQTLDYYHALGDELGRLQDEYKRTESWDTARQRDEVFAELQAVELALRKRSEG